MTLTSRCVAVLACAVFRDELGDLAPPVARISYLRQCLHPAPHVMAEAIRTELDRIDPDSVDKIILA